MKSRSVLIGEQSLLVRCGDVLLEKGFAVAAVISHNPVIADWAAENAIPCFAEEREWLDAVSGKPEAAIDYLFSITNLRVLPAELLALPSQLAINFHDGPLPRYAGLNTPVWALLAGEQEYGISWHVMDADVDAGDILRQSFFPIVPGETAFTLNAKCYQAGLDSFAELVEDLQADQLTRQSQDVSQLEVFYKKDRPAAAALLDWRQPGARLVQIARALDFGNYANPLSAAKILTDRGVLLFAQIEQSDAVVAPAGEVLAVEGDSIRIAASDCSLLLRGLSCQRGLPVDAAGWGLSVGDRLPSPDDSQIQQIDQFYAGIAGREERWLKRFSNYQDLPLPFAVARSDSGINNYSPADDVQLLDALQRCNAALGAQGARVETATQLVAAIATLYARVNRENYASFLCLGESAEIAQAPCDELFSALMPVNVSLAGDCAFAELKQQLLPAINDILERPGFARDLFARNPELRGRHLQSTLLIDLRSNPETSDAVAAEFRSAAAEIVLQLNDQGVQLLLGDGVDQSAAAQLLGTLAHLLEQIASDDKQPVSAYALVDDQQWQQLLDWGEGKAQSLRDAGWSQPIHQQIEAQVARNPDSVAVVFEGQELTYRELNQRANQIAHGLVDSGIAPQSRVGVLLERSETMLAAMLGIWKAGCAYVPLDPVYPAQRIEYMASDAGLAALLCESVSQCPAVDDAVQRIPLQTIVEEFASCPETSPELSLPDDALAYVIYTSGSTGNPKGVMVEHRNVANFFAGMDQRLDREPGNWLAVTSISFDISVLELFWTLCHGFKVVLYADEHRQKSSAARSQYADRDLDFNLFYWNVAEDESEYDENKYELLLEGAKFADNNGFNAVWTPERHFAAFGGLFPNPSVTSAALSTITKNVELRGGSCVAPLHSPIRIAEEWAVVDNLSNGRVGIAIASGWAPPDFAIKPENFADAKQVMFDNAEIARKLWRGETVNMPGPQGEVPVRTLPRPIQPELPVWITTAGNVDSFQKAGEIGANLLTHLLGQTIEEVAEKVTAYRKAWQDAGHSGRGKVTVMLHTFVGPDAAAVEEVVRAPMKRYLKSAMFLVKSAAWQFPTFKKMSEEQGKSLDEFFETISDQDMDDLLEFAFQRYFYTSGLFGTAESCMEMVDKVKGGDIDEIGCLIDFGIDTPTVLEHLPYLAELLQQVKREFSASQLGDADSSGDYSLPGLLAEQSITHLQCTPSMATMLLGDESTRKPLSGLRQMMVGGEAFPPDLAVELKQQVSGVVTNMYGPTETTVWSATADVKTRDTAEPSALVGEEFVSIGTPLLNQSAWVLDEYLRPLPPGVAGELVLGGSGVTRGYHQRESLTADRFVADPYTSSGLRFSDDQPFYRTGDLARWLPDGRLQCLGRVDHQVKIRGYRVELGEIESLCRNHEQVSEAAVVLREDTPGDQRLVAYVVATGGLSTETEQSLRESLAEQLPTFMVPGIFESLERLPLTPNGKIDRNALPAPKVRGQSSEALEESAVPASDAEQMVAGIWQRALGIESIGKRENFFDIGGHSLLVVQVLKELRDSVSKPIQMTDLFRFTTIETLATFISEEQDDGAALDKGQERAAQRKAMSGRRRRRR